MSQQTQLPTTNGQKAAAQFQAAPLPAQPAQLSAVLHTALPMVGFAVIYNGQRITFEAYVRKYCESRLKAVIIASGVDVLWES